MVLEHQICILQISAISDFEILYPDRKQLLLFFILFYFLSINIFNQINTAFVRIKTSFKNIKLLMFHVKKKL